MNNSLTFKNIIEQMGNSKRSININLRQISDEEEKKF